MNKCAVRIRVTTEATVFNNYLFIRIIFTFLLESYLLLRHLVLITCLLHVRMLSNISTTESGFVSFKGLAPLNTATPGGDSGRMQNRVHRGGEATYMSGRAVFLLRLFHASSPPSPPAPSLSLPLPTHVLSAAPLFFSWPLLRSCCLVTAEK